MVHIGSEKFLFTKKLEVRMNCKKTLALCMAIGLILGTYHAFAQTAEELLSKGMQLEEVKGELEKAIEIYQTIVDKFSDNRPVAAEALLHIGLCNEKLGKQEAQKAYQRIIREFADQNEVVAEARTRLAALEKPVGPGVAKGIVVRQVWSGPDVDTYGTPSPDGRYLSYTDWETGDLAIRELTTGKTRRLTKKGTQKQPAVFALNSVISPDNKLVAYSWTNEYGTYDLCLIGIDGSGNRILYNSNDKDEVYPASWSSDGKQIAARRYSVKGEKAEIISIAVADGSVKVLKTFEKLFWPRFCYSPDDRFIAYDFPDAENSGNFDISLIYTDGSGEISLIEHPANDRLLGWTPGRKEILFLSNRSGTWDAWIIQVDNGKPLGGPKRIKPDLGQVSPMAFTQNGSFYFSIYTRRFTTQIAPFDLKTGKVQEQLSKILLGSYYSAEWSPDGEYLAYITEQTTPAGGTYHRPLHVLNLGTGEERELAGHCEVRAPRWSSDGRSILFTGLDNNRRNQEDYNGGVYKIDLQTGNVNELVQFPPVQEPFHINFFRDVWWTRSIADWSYDGNSVFYVNRGRIFMRELESGREKLLYQNNNLRKLLDLSPDGKRLVFGTENSDDGTWSILIMPVSGGEPWELCKFSQESEESEGIGFITWAPDGQYVLFMKNINKVSALWRISPEGGEPQKLKLWQSENRYSGLSIHPDGQQIAFSTYEQDMEIWVMENFLPE
jgi:Tol biopolymer transport system component